MREYLDEKADVLFYSFLRKTDNVTLESAVGAFASNDAQAVLEAIREHNRQVFITESLISDQSAEAVKSRQAKFVTIDSVLKHLLELYQSAKEQSESRLREQK